MPNSTTLVKTNSEYGRVPKDQIFQFYDATWRFIVEDDSYYVHLVDKPRIHDDAKPVSHHRRVGEQAIDLNIVQTFSPPCA